MMDPGRAALPFPALFIWAFSAGPLLQSIVPPAVLGLWLENRSLFWYEFKKQKQNQKNTKKQNQNKSNSFSPFLLRFQ